MTTKEALTLYTVSEYTTSIGDNLTSIVRYLYGEYIDKAYYVIKEINQRYDWSYMQGGEKIKYFKTNILNMIDVFYSEK